MAEQCKNCGAELFAGAHFCRACGRPSQEIVDEHAPTQRMEPQQSESWGPRQSVQTAPTSRPDTNAIYAPPGAYQPTVPPMYAQGAPPPFQAPPRHSPVGWLVAALCTGLFIALIVGVLAISRAVRHRVQIGSGGPRIQIKTGEAALDNTTAEQLDESSNETSIVKTFDADGDTDFAIQNVSGDVVIETWDQDKAQVKVIKRGGSIEERKNTTVVFLSNDNKLQFRTAQSKNYVEVRYEVKLPQEVAKINIKTVSGAVKLSKTTADTAVESVSGPINLVDIAGLRNLKTTSGNVSAVLRDKLEEDTSMDLNSVSGNIDLRVRYDLNANLNAETVSGAISVDDAFGVPVQKKIPGARAAGQIGEGGQSLRIRTVSGAIKLGK
jgi:putative adhesin